MKTILYKANSRGQADYGWLKTNYSFSFADYYNPERIHFGALRVLNDDIIAPASGFDTHPHDNMEIVTIPLSGAVAHKDSMGHTSVISSDEIQVMSAGTGIYHSEFNASNSELLKLLQIWIYPDKKNVKPRYEQMKYDLSKSDNSWLTLVAPEKSTDTLWLNQNAWFSMLASTNEIESNYKINKPGNGVFIFVIEGGITIGNETLQKRDAIGVWECDEVILKAGANSKILLIEIPMK